MFPSYSRFVPVRGCQPTDIPHLTASGGAVPSEPHGVADIYVYHFSAREGDKCDLSCFCHVLEGQALMKVGL